MDFFRDTILSGVAYDVLKFLFFAGLASGATTIIAKKFLNIFESKKDVLFFSSLVFCVLFVGFLMFAPRSQTPSLSAGIETVTTGTPDNPSVKNVTFAIFSMTIMNSGSMQTIAKSWSVEAKIFGKNYSGAFLTQPPRNFAMKTANPGPGEVLGIVFHSEDSLINKSLTPIQPGGLANGVLYVVFEGIDPQLLKGGVEYTVHFQDVFSRKYEASIPTSAVSASFAVSPGLHSELVCPIPPSNPPVRNASPIDPNGYSLPAPSKN